jgi:hypothetical protein
VYPPDLIRFGSRAEDGESATDRPWRRPCPSCSTGLPPTLPPRTDAHSLPAGRRQHPSRRPVEPRLRRTGNRVLCSVLSSRFGCSCKLTCQSVTGSVPACRVVHFSAYCL